MENYHSNQRRPYRQSYVPKTHPPETILAEQKIFVERKSYHISRRANERGQFVVITEDRLPQPGDRPGGFERRNRIIVPAEGIANFIAAIQHVSTL